MKKQTLINIIFFGSLWGATEAVLGGILHFISFPFTGVILSSIGFTILFQAANRGVRYSELPLISLIAASFKFLDPFIFGVSFLHITVINPFSAIVSQGISFALVFGLFRNRRLNDFVKFFASTAMYMLIFNLVSVLIFNEPTYQTQNLTETILFNLPATSLLALAISRACLFASENLNIEINNRIKIAATTLCTSLIAVSKFF